MEDVCRPHRHQAQPIRESGASRTSRKVPQHKFHRRPGRYRCRILDHAVSVHSRHLGLAAAFAEAQFQGNRSRSRLIGWLLGQAVQHVPEVGERFDVVELSSG